MCHQYSFLHGEWRYSPDYCNAQVPYTDGQIRKYFLDPKSFKTLKVLALCIGLVRKWAAH